MTSLYINQVGRYSDFGPKSQVRVGDLQQTRHQLNSVLWVELLTESPDVPIS